MTNTKHASLPATIALRDLPAPRPTLWQRLVGLLVPDGPDYIPAPPSSVYRTGSLRTQRELRRLERRGR